jgi:hypothetical protein
MSLIKFQIHKDSGKWNSLSPEQEHIVALTSEVTHLKDHNLKLAKNATPIKGKNYGDKPTQYGKGKKLSKKAADGEKWAWNKVPPKEGEHQSKQIPDSDKTPHWCKDDQAWVVHSQLPAQFKLPVKKQKQISLFLQYLKGLNLMSETLSLCPVLLLLGI